MATKRLTLGHSAMTVLTYDQASWLIEYVKDRDAYRACTARGLSPELGAEYLRDPNVKDALRRVDAYQEEQRDIDAEWLMWELVDNHHLARQQGKLSQSNKALEVLGRLSVVDAFAAEKVDIHVDEDLVDRLNRGRRRAAERGHQATPVPAEHGHQATPVPAADETPDFMGTPDFLGGA